MSLRGQLHRGKKWYELYRDKDGNMTEAVANDPNKMADVNKYVEWLKTQAAPTPVKETKSKKEK